MNRLCFLSLLWVLGLASCHTGDTFRMLARSDPRVLYSVDTEEPLIALTIDDGPDREATLRILEVLDAHAAKATFFLISDRTPGQESIVRAIVDADHEIANHLTAEGPSIELDPAKFESELIRAHRTLSRFGDSNWFRPGSGWYDDWMFPILERHDYRLALGNSYALDAQIHSVWFATRVILWRASRGDIIILHDGEGRGERTVEILEKVLPELKRRGLRVVSLSELVEVAEVSDEPQPE
jgi:peptidoglycan/xylan/chitin deacetylase (PgdA/CDA1 family)